MSNNELTQPMDLPTLQREVQVTLGGEAYFLREASGDAAVKYVNARTNSVRLDKRGGGLSVHNIGNLAPLLVSLTLFDADGKPVAESTIRAWPNTTQEALYERSLDLSGLRDVDAAPLASLHRALDEEGSPVSFDDLTDWVMDHTDKKDDQPLRLMIREHLKDNEGEEGNF